MREHSREDKVGRGLLAKGGFRSCWRGYGCSPLDGGEACWVVLARTGPQSPGIRKEPSGVQVSWGWWSGAQSEWKYLEPTHWQDGTQSAIRGICVGAAVGNSLWGTSEPRPVSGDAESWGTIASMRPVVHHCPLWEGHVLPAIAEQVLKGGCEVEKL